MKKMSSWLNVNSFDKRDEYYTPKILVEVLVPYIKDFEVIWCPFDTESSEFVQVFRDLNKQVYYSHIWAGQDFFTWSPDDHYDCIISNPPFSMKLKVFDRLYKLNKPFAMVMGLPILNYQEVGSFFLDKELQLLIVDKKISFDGKTASFNNSYFCSKFLPRDICFVHLEHNNTNNNFKSSRMRYEGN